MKTRATFVPAGAGERLDVLGTPMTFLATAAETTSTYEVVVVEADASGEPLAHRHPWEEFYFVLEGTLEVQVGARRHTAAPGAFVSIPARAIHSFTVTSDRARFLHVSMGSGATAAWATSTRSRRFLTWRSPTAGDPASPRPSAIVGVPPPGG